MKLTQEEKAAVCQYLSSDPSIWGTVKEYWPILVPIIALEGLSLLNEDVVAALLANLILFGFMFWFFKRGGESGSQLKSALSKYEAEVSAIDN